MGLVQSPKIVTNGLVFYYDQNNIKSYVGPAIQNRAPGLASNYGSVPSTATGRSYSGGTEVVNVPQIGPTTVAFTNIQNNYTSFTPNSTDCCPSPHTYTGNFAVSPSTLYTYAIVYKVLSGYTHANFMYRYEYTSNGGSYVTEGGVHNTSNRVHLGDDWYWAWGTFTTQATTNWIQYAGSYYYRYSNETDKFSIARVLIVQGDYTGLHPRHWPAVNTTRANTAALLDPIGKNTITATSLTYAANGSFSFNGSSNYITVPLTNLGSQRNTFTIELWARLSGSTANLLFNAKGQGLYPRITNTGSNIVQVQYRPNGVTTSINSNTITLNTWYHFVFTYDSSAGGKLYTNGILTGSETTTLGTHDGGTSGSMLIGNDTNLNYWGKGDIDIVKMYDKVLTAVEIQQNFNALRGRYGI
jgi:hypothetical protein